LIAIDVGDGKAVTDGDFGVDGDGIEPGFGWSSGGGRGGDAGAKGEGEQGFHGGEVEGVVGGDSGGADGGAEVGLVEDPAGAVMGEDPEITASGSDVDATIGNEGGGPDFALEFVGPQGFAGPRVETMEVAHGIGDVDQAVLDGGGGHGVATEGSGPDEVGGGDIAAATGSDAFHPGGVLAPEPIPAAGHVQQPVVDDGHAVDVAGAGGLVAVEAVHILLRCVWIKVETPPGLDPADRFVGGMILGQWIESVEDAVAAGEEEAGFALDDGEGRGRPGAVEDAWGDVFVVAGEDPAGVFVQDEKAGGIRGADLFVGVVHAGTGIEIEMVSVDEDGGMGGVMGPDAGFAGQVGMPEDIGVHRPEGNERFAFGGLETGFIGEGTVIAIGETEEVEAEDLAAIGHHVDPVAIDGGRGREAGLGPVVIGIFGSFRTDQLPEQFAGLFIQAEQHAAVALMSDIAGIAVVGADQDPAVGDDGGGMGFSAEFDGPTDSSDRTPDRSTGGNPVSVETGLRVQAWPICG